MVFQYSDWLNQHFNTQILILVSIFNFLWKLFTFCKPFGWNINVRFELSLCLLETSSVSASLIPLQHIWNFQPFQANSGRKKKKNRKNLQTLLFLMGSQFVQAVTLRTQELICSGKQLRASCNWLWVSWCFQDYRRCIIDTTAGTTQELKMQVRSQSNIKHKRNESLRLTCEF